MAYRTVTAVASFNQLGRDDVHYSHGQRAGILQVERLRPSFTKALQAAAVAPFFVRRFALGLPFCLRGGVLHGSHLRKAGAPVLSCH